MTEVIEEHSEWMHGLCPACQTMRLMHESWNKCQYCESGRRSTGNHIVGQRRVTRTRMPHLEEARTSLGLSKGALAQYAGVTRNTIMRIENGGRANATTREAIEEALELLREEAA